LHRKTTDHPAGNLGKLVAKLPDFLAPPSTPYPRTAREAVRQADKGVLEAVEFLNEVARRHKAAVRPFDPLPDKLLSAQKVVAAARSAQQRAQDALESAKQRRAAKFLSDTEKKLAEAAETLTWVIDLVRDAFSPICDLHDFAVREQLPLPRALQSAPQIREGILAATRLVNELSE
jgi:hypothetical protein